MVHLTTIHSLLGYIESANQYTRNATELQTVEIQVKWLAGLVEYANRVSKELDALSDCTSNNIGEE